MSSHSLAEPGWIHGHSHEPNPMPPTSDTTITLRFTNGPEQSVTVADLMREVQVTIDDCYIVSTGHGTSGPFCFGGTPLLDLLRSLSPTAPQWNYVDVVSADTFGTRIRAAELFEISTKRPILLAYQIDGDMLTREQGLVRLIVPTETDDALRQVKWVSRIEVHA